MHLLEFGAVTDCGPVRSVNEDSILAAPPVFVVADGVGGSADGEVASAIVVEEFGRLAEQPVIDADRVSATIQAAHTRVWEHNAGRPHGASSTAVGAVGVLSGDEPYWVVFNVGDSRIYRLGVATPEASDRTLSQISVDHSHVQELVDAEVITADQATTHPDRNLVTRAIGAEEEVEADFWLIPMVPGDRLLICSDGLLAVSDPDLQRALSGDAGAERTAADLLQAALAAETTDNVSVIVIDVVARGTADRTATPQSEELTSVQPHPAAAESS
ncbi:PP2C family protein-serine/threonine phosphatase [Microlunatus soli]|uniref:Protein phosphatase n=1 Tax=Microlunatus soli TaxID=630515 RepID=A0A1H1VEM7_9ACTN|nr:PP2C family serine/threonine-protein phosphatase [Microlunatus soli]SDS83232.1 protein phosphatase [Microlunatus soli]